MTSILCTLLMFANAGFAECRPHIPLQSTDIPESVTRLFKATGLDRQYDFSSHLKPSYLRGDFDGDGKPDVAILVKHKTSRKVGIAVCHSSTNKILLIGAGTTVGNGGDNFDWMDIWNVTPKASAAKKVGKARAALLKGDALHVEKSESASALIYWNGRKYVWHQQGD
ncbi:MAG: hypothetical protein AABO57_06780 [Acidobacteriota bacterium]